MEKEIHFYESLGVIPNNVKVFYDWQSTRDAIDETCLEDIHTTQMCLLSTSLFVREYRVFVHQDNGVVYELTLQNKERRGDHSVRLGQNMYGMWASNVFRFLQTVGDYVKPTQKWNIPELKYSIDGIVYINVGDIPCDVKNMIVKKYKFDSNDNIIRITTITE